MFFRVVYCFSILGSFFIIWLSTFWRFACTPQTYTSQNTFYYSFLHMWRGCIIVAVIYHIEAVFHFLNDPVECFGVGGSLQTADGDIFYCFFTDGHFIPTLYQQEMIIGAQEFSFSFDACSYFLVRDTGSIDIVEQYIGIIDSWVKWFPCVP